MILLSTKSVLLHLKSPAEKELPGHRLCLCELLLPVRHRRRRRRLCSLRKQWTDVVHSQVAQCHHAACSLHQKMSTASADFSTQSPRLSFFTSSSQMNVVTYTKPVHHVFTWASCPVSFMTEMAKAKMAAAASSPPFLPHCRPLSPPFNNTG